MPVLAANLWVLNPKKPVWRERIGRHRVLLPTGNDDVQNTVDVPNTTGTGPAVR